MFLNIDCDEPLSVFCIVILKSFPLSAPVTSIPVDSIISKNLEPVRLPSDAPLFTLTPGLLSVASERTNEPSASHLSVAKLYTIECEPVTFDAAFECVPTPVNDLVSIPNPPVVGSVVDVPVSIKVSSTSNFVVFNIVSAPLTVRSPVTVRLPEIVALLLTAKLPSPGSVPDQALIPCPCK